MIDFSLSNVEIKGEETLKEYFCIKCPKLSRNVSFMSKHFLNSSNNENFSTFLYNYKNEDLKADKVSA